MATKANAKFCLVLDTSAYSQDSVHIVSKAQALDRESHGHTQIPKNTPKEILNL